MPVRKVGNKYAIGKGKPVFKTKKKALAAQRAVKARGSGHKDTKR